VLRIGLLATFTGNWAVGGIPSIIMAGLGKEKMTIYAKLSAIPLVLLLVTFIPLMISMGYRDGPSEFILLLYLEFLYVLMVGINFSLTIPLLSKFNKTIVDFKKRYEYLPMDMFVQQYP
jgi:hypothetical protein